jgi:hypothetical protein
LLEILIVLAYILDDMLAMFARFLKMVFVRN